VSLQRVDEWREDIKERFVALKHDQPARLERRMNLSWSNWGFGLEDLETSARRLARADLAYIELHGNHYGPDLGYRVDETQEVLTRHGLAVSGVCGMFSNDNDLSSNRALHRQAAIEYIRREVEFTAAMGGGYLLVVPGAVGRPVAYDNAEFDRSVATLRLVADAFTNSGIKGAIEPIRSAEVSLVRSISDAVTYIEAVDHPGIQHINGDVYHMQSEEPNIPLGILEAGDRLVNLHMADSNRMGLGQGSLDLDTIIMALYLIGHNTEGRFVTPEPLGPGGAPYPAMNSRHDPAELDSLVLGSIAYFREREDAVLGL
jgi:D-psicose/D-tagatose/L-ribulose 3-epimerase